MNSATMSEMVVNAVCAKRQALGARLYLQVIVTPLCLVSDIGYELIGSYTFRAQRCPPYSCDRLGGLKRDEDRIGELCREAIVQNRWSKDFTRGGKKRLAGDTTRAATSDEVKDLRREGSALKEVVARTDPRTSAVQKSV